MSRPLDLADIESIRRCFPALANYTWFQNGGVSITPKPVAEEHARLMKDLFENGPAHIVFPEQEAKRRQTTMERLAGFFAVSPDELALTRGVSEAYQTVLRGLDWNPGDEVILSQDEEAALLLPTLHLRDLCGVKVVKLPLLEDAADQLAALSDLFSERTKLIAVSQVTTDLGWRLPMAELCRLARERGVLSFADIAHSAGLFPIDLYEMDCDCAGILSYKWMYAPYAAGMLYARRQSQDRLTVAFAGGRSEKSLDFERDSYQLHDTAQRFQYGPWSWPLVHAWATAADWLSDIGLSTIERRTAELTARLKRKLNEIDKVTLFTPVSARRTAALVSFGLCGWTGEQLANSLRTRWNMVVKPLPHSREGLRISVPFFLLEEEIDRLAAAIGTLAAEPERPETQVENS